MTRALLKADFLRATRDPNTSDSDFDYFANITLPVFLRLLYKWGAHNSHIQYIPKLILTLTEDTWQYDFLSTAKYTNLTASDTAGVVSITGAKSTYFLAPGDLATYDSTDYYVHNVTSTTIQLDTSVGNSSKALYIYARPLLFTDAYLLDSDGEAGTDEIPVQQSDEMLAPLRHGIGEDYELRNLKYRPKGDKLEISWNPDSGDKLHLFYVSEPIKFDYTNTIMAALTNPTQLTREGNRAFVWAMGENYWLQKGEEKDAAFCARMYRKILDTAGAFNG